MTFARGNLTRRELIRNRTVALAALGTIALLGACTSAPAPSPPAAKPPEPTAAPKPAATAAPAAPTQAPAATAAPPAAAPAAAKPALGPGYMRPPEANPKRGGVLRTAFGATTAHFDIHQGGTAAVLTQMYNGLVRRNIMDGVRTVVPDVAERWEMAPDGKAFTFFLRDGVKFHDGGALSADDAVATFTRIVNPPAGMASILKDQLAMVDKVSALDKLKVHFALKRPAPLFLDMLAQITAVIYSKKALDENNGDLRRVIAPGTGPFMLKEHRSGEKWILVRNPDYWDRELPYLDGLEMLHVPAATDRGTAVLTGQADFTWNTSVDTVAEALKRKDVVTVATPPSLGSLAVHINNAHKPFDDARVRRALQLAVSRQNLIEAYKTQEDLIVTRWMNPGPGATPPEQLAKMPGYRADKKDDIAEAKKLLADAGVPNGFGPVELVSSNLPIFSEVMAPALEQELKKNLGIAVKIRVVERAVEAQDYIKGNFDLAICAGCFVGPLLDPTPLWQNYLRTGATANYARYSNPEIDKILDELDVATDQNKRAELFGRAMDILDRDVPLFQFGTPNHRIMWQNYVKGGYLDNRLFAEWGRFDCFWIDK